MFFNSSQSAIEGHPIISKIERFLMFCHGWSGVACSRKLLLQLIVHNLRLWQLWQKISMFEDLICYGFSIICNNIWWVSKLVLKSSLIVKNNAAIFCKTHKILLGCCAALIMYFLHIFNVMMLARMKKMKNVFKRRICK